MRKLLLLLLLTASIAKVGAFPSALVTLLEPNTYNISISKLAKALSEQDGGESIIRQNMERLNIEISNAQARITHIMLPEDSGRAKAMRKMQVLVAVFDCVLHCSPSCIEKIIAEGSKADANNDLLEEFLLHDEIYCD